MAGRKRFFWALLPLFAAAPALAADENADLDLVPDTLLTAPQASRGPAETGRWHWDLIETVHLNRYRSVTVPSLNADEPAWVSLSRLSVRGDSPLSETTTLTLDAQFNLQANEGHSFDALRDLRLDLKEAYVTYAPDPAIFLDVGRIVIRNGVAYGFNPTDAFRVNAVVNRTTEDPGALRYSRLGAMAFRAQAMWEGGALAIVAAPRIGGGSGRLWTDSDVVGLGLNKTNDRSRVLFRLSQRIVGDVAPDVVAGAEGGEPFVGLSGSVSAGDKLMLYGEWLGARRRALYDQAMGVGKVRLIQQAALGFSWTSETELVANIEYHHNGAGMNGDQWRRWFADGASGRGGLRGRLWSVRGLARDRQEPASRHTLFARVQQSNAFVPDLTLTGLAIVNPLEWDHLVQLEAGYALTSTMTAAVRASWSGGADRSERGSVSRSGAVAVELAIRL